MTFLLLYQQDKIAEVFGAFVAAEKGDPSGLALLSFMYDRMIPKAVNWGDNLSKVMSADYDPNSDYEAEMMPVEAILGSPMSKILGAMKYGGWPIKSIPEQYRQLQFCDAETLLINSNIDFSTPVEYARDELLPYLKRGRLVVVAEAGHCDDVMNLQSEAFQHLVKKFYDEGIIDDSQFHYEPMNFSPATSLPEMAKKFVRKTVYFGLGALLVLISLFLTIIWIIKRRN